MLQIYTFCFLFGNVSPALTCDQLTTIEDGFYYPKKNNYSYMETVTFACEDPKQISGAAILTCKEDGQWDNLEPECKGICMPICYLILVMGPPRLRRSARQLVQ